MGGGPPRTNVKPVPGKKHDLSDGDGGVAISCLEEGHAEVAVSDPAPLGRVGSLVEANDSVDFVVNGVVAATVTGAAAARLLRCIRRGHEYRGELEAADGGTTVLRYWMV